MTGVQTCALPISPIYEQLLARLRATDSDGRGVREFVRILRLHRTYPAEAVEQGIGVALEYGCLHADGVELCIRQGQPTPPLLPALDLQARPHLAQVGRQPLDLRAYDQLLAAR